MPFRCGQLTRLHGGREFADKRFDDFFDYSDFNWVGDYVTKICELNR